MTEHRYLDLLEDILTGALLEDPALPSTPLRIRHRWKYNPGVRESGLDWPSKAWTMVGRKRLHNFRVLIERALDDGIAGDIMETGVWRGGACMLARAILLDRGIGDRRVILADSFEGLPAPDPQYPLDAESRLHEYEDLAVPLEDVQDHFRKFGLLDDQVMFVKGWFSDTLPALEVERLCVLRLDGDMYVSTIDALNHLYDKVSVGGWVIIDDYNVVESCRRAVHDFLDSRGLEPQIHQIDGVGVYFQKTA